MHRISRRDLLTGLAAGAAAVSFARPALAQELGQLEMRERYDSAASSIAALKSSSPTFSPYTVQATTNAIAQYTEIAAAAAGRRCRATGA